MKVHFVSLFGDNGGPATKAKRNGFGGARSASSVQEGALFLSIGFPDA
ncbi:hypothetical protein [Saccharococcus thermophilus]